MMSDEQLAQMYREAGLDPDLYIPKIKYARQHKENYYNVLHVCCPECGCDRYSSTYLGFIVNPENPDSFVDSNDVQCAECGWKGITHDLVRRQE